MRPPRSVRAAALAIVLLTSVTSSAQAEAAFTPSGAVTFDVDHTKKTIEVTVKLAFYNRSCTPGASCDVPATDVKRIVDDIERMWNTGQMVKCYTFKVKVEARTAGSQSEAGQSEVDIGLDYGPIPVHPHVTGSHHIATVTNPLSNSPDDRVEPAHDPSSPTTWPAHTYMQTYAHEFGHILGLDDNYVGKGFYPGASEDLMFRKQGFVTPEIVKRVVERSGQVTLKDLICGWTLRDVTPIGLFQGTKCDDDVGGVWTVQGDQTVSIVSFTTLWNTTIDRNTMAGTYKYESIQKAGPTLTVGNSSGKANVVSQQDGSVLMTLEEQPITVKVTALGRTTSTKLAPHGWKFLWLPAAKGVCP